MSRTLRRLALAKNYAQQADQIMSVQILFISSVAALLLLKARSLLSLFFTVFCLGCLSLTCFSLDLFVPHFGS